MSSLKAYEYSLQRLLSELRQQKTELIAAPGRARPEESEYTELSRKLEVWAQRLRPLARELRNREQFQAMRGRQLHQVPRQARYSEQQSIDGHLANVRALWPLVAEVIAELDQINRQRHGPYTLHDVVRGVEDIARDWAERTEKVNELVSTLQARSDGPEFRVATNFDKPVAPGDIANLVVMGVMLLAWLAQRLKK